LPVNPTLLRLILRNGRATIGSMAIEKRFHGVVWLVLAILAMSIAAIVLATAAVGVRIVDCSLVDGAQDLPITAPIRFTFSQAMEPASVDAHFYIEPEVEGALRWHGRELVFQPEAAWAPDVSYKVTLLAGASSQDGRTLQQDHTWSFRTRAPELLYLGRVQPGAMQRQIFLVPSDGGAPRQLTHHPAGAWDFAVHPQGERITFSVEREDGGSDLWLMDRDGGNQRLLLACPAMTCLAPAWSPDGRLLAYEKRRVRNEGPDLDPEASRIWLLDLETGEERRLFDYDVALHAPAWAPTGQRLAYLSPLLSGFEIYDLPSGELWQFPSEWGAAPAWAPDGHQLVLSEMSFAGEAIAARLLRIDLASESASPLGAADELYRDDSPAWSPAGTWIAFGRQFIDPERRMPGRQLWLVRPDGLDAHPLVAEPMADLYGFAWRPDGAALAYLQVDLSQGFQPVPDVSVWVYDLERDRPRKVADDGVMPRWLP
jgi:Tol biopolymer transport system component